MHLRYFKWIVALNVQFFTLLDLMFSTYGWMSFLKLFFVCYPFLLMHHCNWYHRHHGAASAAIIMHALACQENPLKLFSIITALPLYLRSLLKAITIYLSATIKPLQGTHTNTDNLCNKKGRICISLVCTKFQIFHFKPIPLLLKRCYSYDFM